VGNPIVLRPAAVAAQFGAPVSPHLATEPPQGFWDCWTLLAALAGITSRLRLGTLVSCTGYRNPVVLATMAVTLDEASGGRLMLGLGAAMTRTNTGRPGSPAIIGSVGSQRR